jgi:hypothetical protein
MKSRAQDLLRAALPLFIIGAVLLVLAPAKLMLAASTQ